MSNSDLHDEEPLFKSAHAAIRFAVTFEGRPERPAMNRVTDKHDIHSAPKGLHGIDGAAQAGIIRSKMRNLGYVMDAILVARSAPHAMKCECRRSCCSGSTPSPVWQAAINVLTDEVGPAIKAKGRLAHDLRMAFVMRAFGENILLKDIGERFELDESTMTAYNAKVMRWFKGQKASQHHPAIEGVENIAWREIETVLTACGIVG